MAKSHHSLPTILFCSLFWLSWGTSVLSLTIPLEDSEMTKLYEEWMVKYGRVHDSLEEKERRFKIFKANVEHINAHNSVEGRMYDLAVNKFADLTSEEFKAKYTGLLKSPDRMTMARRDNSPLDHVPESVDDVPTSIDWRKKGAVGGIRDQKCRSCWAYSVVAAMEGIVQIKTGELLDLSEQELIECDTFDDGCEGGYLDTAFSWIILNRGLNSEKGYPSKSGQAKCDKGASSVSAASITGYDYVPENDEKALQLAVSKQPVSVTIDSGGFFWYEGGVYNGSCGTDLDHAVTIVGYNATDEGIPYWILKNSWGRDWGEDGYMRILKDVDAREGKCGLAMEGTYPLIG